MTGFSLPKNYTDNPERLVRRARPRVVPPLAILPAQKPIQEAPPVLGSNKHTPHEGESRDITTIHILQHRHRSYYNKFKVLITDPNLGKHYTSHKFKVQSQSSGKTTRRLQHVAKGYQASPSKVSLVGVIAGRRRIPLYGPASRQRAVIGQASNLILKSHTWKGFNNKAEYTNTQQDLTVNGYT